MFYGLQKSLPPKKMAKYISRSIGEECEGHVIISNLITYLTSSSSVASKLSGQKSWISALPVFTEAQMSIHSKLVCN